MAKNTTVKCLACGEVLISTHRHDFVQCHCPNKTFADGGSDYFRCGALDLGKVAEQNEAGEWVPIIKEMADGTTHA